jgi:hypothetical protein
LDNLPIPTKFKKLVINMIDFTVVEGEKKFDNRMLKNKKRGSLDIKVIIPPLLR